MFEHQIIEDFFLDKLFHRPDVLVGIGDDAAIVTVPDNKQLVVTMDTFTAGIHFPYPIEAVDKLCLDTLSSVTNPNITPAYDIGYKAAAINLSDLAAMGAEPAWATMSLSIPEVNSQWLEEFSTGFSDLLKRFKVTLIGGDLCRGPLSITVQLQGLVDPGKTILRSTINVDDLIYVSGELGTAAYAFDLVKREGDIGLLQKVIPALNQPQPRVELGRALVGVATAAMDVSDGLCSDLSRMLRSRHFGAVVDLAMLPINNVLKQNLAEADIHQHAFTGGDDYELCFTVSPDSVEQVEQISQELTIPLTQIGKITSMPGITLLNGGENCAKLKKHGYEHFRART